MAGRGRPRQQPGLGSISAPRSVAQSTTEAEFMLIDHGMTEGSSDVAGTPTVEIDLCDLGIIVLDHEGRVASTNAQARDLLRADSASTLNDRLEEIQRRLSKGPRSDAAADEMAVDVPGIGELNVRSCAVDGTGTSGRVLLLRDGRSLSVTKSLLQQASRHRSFASLARDWAHDLKGMLHVIRINSALLGRLLQREPATTDAAVTRCLDAIPREVERLDRSIESMFAARSGELHSTFDVGAMCERLRSLIAARANRQRVEVVLELNGGSKYVAGFEDQVQCAIMNVIVNALEAMPEQGRLVIAATGGVAGVTVRVCDTGAGIPPQRDGRLWRPHFANPPHRTGIGLHVARAIVESHHGRIECASNVPRGTCIQITFPMAASTGRF
jgi:two-component system, NtrC family, sensor histidine kinase HydH